jgi:hypothetical protein
MLRPMQSLKDPDRRTRHITLDRRLVATLVLALLPMGARPIALGRLLGVTRVLEILPMEEALHLTTLTHQTREIRDMGCLIMVILAIQSQRRSVTTTRPRIMEIATTRPRLMNTTMIQPRLMNTTITRPSHTISTIPQLHIMESTTPQPPRQLQPTAT